jgi:hypothetical protein
MGGEFATRGLMPQGNSRLCRLGEQTVRGIPTITTGLSPTYSREVVALVDRRREATYLHMQTLRIAIWWKQTDEGGEGLYTIFHRIILQSTIKHQRMD